LRTAASNNSLTYKQSINCTDSSTPVIDRTLLILLTLLPSIEGVHDRFALIPCRMIDIRTTNPTKAQSCSAAMRSLYLLKRRLRQGVER